MSVSFRAPFGASGRPRPRGRLPRGAAAVLGLAVVLGLAGLQPAGAGGSGESRPAAPPDSPAAQVEDGFPLTVVDDSGVPVVVQREPRRIISLTAFTDEVLLELVSLERLLGVTLFSQDPDVSNVVEEAAAVRHKLQLNVEVIVSLRPDLVFVANWTDASEVAQLRGSGIPVFLLSTGLRVEEIERKILTVGRVVGETKRARELVADMEARLAEVDARLAAIPSEARLSVMDYTTWGSAQGRGSSWDEIVTRAGLVNAVAGLEADAYGQVPLSRETMLRLDPDLLILPGWVYGKPFGARSFYESVVRDPALRGLEAIRAGRVYSMPEGLRAASSQYIVDAVEYLSRLAYPQLWEE
ncbi:MAG: ABC transporter substrate-binding protein [Spirochaetales bacterium]|nr:ABC transporter substrate-binding protein [Spirochaetales bacterium]